MHEEQGRRRGGGVAGAQRKPSDAGRRAAGKAHQGHDASALHFVPFRSRPPGRQQLRVRAGQPSRVLPSACDSRSQGAGRGRPSCGVCVGAQGRCGGWRPGARWGGHSRDAAYGRRTTTRGAARAWPGRTCAPRRWHASRRFTARWAHARASMAHPAAQRLLTPAWVSGENPGVPLEELTRVAAAGGGFTGVAPLDALPMLKVRPGGDGWASQRQP